VHNCLVFDLTLALRLLAVEVPLAAILRFVVQDPLEDLFALWICFIKGHTSF